MTRACSVAIQRRGAVAGTESVGEYPGGRALSPKKVRGRTRGAKLVQLSVSWLCACKWFIVAVV